jgi:hypothetical protein
MTRAVLALALVAGCARTLPYSREPLPCQAQAVDLVWRQAYGRTDRPPDVWWVPREAQTCGRVAANGARGFPGPVMVDGGMVSGCAGASAGGEALVNLVWYGSWPQTGLAHELAHVSQARAGLPPDYAHASPAFGPGGAVERANAQLAAMGPCLSGQ